MRTKPTEAELRPTRRLLPGVRERLEQLDACKPLLRSSGIRSGVSYRERQDFHRVNVHFYTVDHRHVANWCPLTGKLWSYRRGELKAKTLNTSTAISIAIDLAQELRASH
jgi:hypothetical protein